jgi:excisionase family DNA binding protein
MDSDLDYCALCGCLLQWASERRQEEMLVGDLLTTKEAAELLRVSHWTVSAWLSQGKLPRIKAGGRTLISKADLENFLRQSSESQSA